MLTLLYLAIVVAFVCFTWQAIQVYGQRRSSYTLLLTIVLAGLVYDTLVILLGRFIGEGSLLATLNAGRYLVHGIATPFMIIFGFGVLRRAGVSWAKGRIAHILICILTTLLIGLGIYEDILALDLQPHTVMDTLRYVNEGGLKGPPIPALLTIILLIAWGVILWRKTGWSWLAAGGLLMFIAAGLGMGNIFYIGNLGEVALSLANVLTARKFLGLSDNDGGLRWKPTLSP
ncbi:hypothetical protein [Roseiflexus sp.]